MSLSSWVGLFLWRQTEDLCKGRHERRLHLSHGHASSQQPLHGRHAAVADAPRHDQAEMQEIRADVQGKAVAGAQITLCLVRQANRDGHVMRTFEAPAMGACMLTEDTDEHRALFGDSGVTTVHFSSPDDLVAEVKWLLARPQDRRRMAQAAYALITEGSHSYADRLHELLSTSDEVDKTG